jgi:septal ring factor EnvC (AmiA/AmiB activator)
MEDELEEVKRDIQKAKADLERAQERGDRELEWERDRRLNLLLEEKKRLTTGLAKLIKYNFEDRSTDKALWNILNCIILAME